MAVTAGSMRLRQVRPRAGRHCESLDETLLGALCQGWKRVASRTLSRNVTVRQDQLPNRMVERRSEVVNDVTDHDSEARRSGKRVDSEGVAVRLRVEAAFDVVGVRSEVRARFLSKTSRCSFARRHFSRQPWSEGSAMR